MKRQLTWKRGPPSRFILKFSGFETTLHQKKNLMTNRPCFRNPILIAIVELLKKNLNLKRKANQNDHLMIFLTISHQIMFSAWQKNIRNGFWYLCRTVCPYTWGFTVYKTPLMRTVHYNFAWRDGDENMVHVQEKRISLFNVQLPIAVERAMVYFKTSVILPRTKSLYMNWSFCILKNTMATYHPKVIWISGWAIKRCNTPIQLNTMRWISLRWV